MENCENLANNEDRVETTTEPVVRIDSNGASSSIDFNLHESDPRLIIAESLARTSDSSSNGNLIKKFSFLYFLDLNDFLLLLLDCTSQTAVTPPANQQQLPLFTQSSLGVATSSGGPTLYRCNVCQYTCAQKFHFNSHMNTHTDRQCAFCDYTSRTEGRLKKHMAEAHRPPSATDDLTPHGLKVEPEDALALFNATRFSSPPSPSMAHVIGCGADSDGSPDGMDGANGSSSLDGNF